MTIPRFSFRTYADNIKNLIAEGYSILRTVEFLEYRTSDVGLPAFLMQFEETGFPGSLPLRDEEGAYYVDVIVNVSGVLLLPKYPDDTDKDRNMAIASHQAGTNIAALVYAGARGWNCDPPKIEGIEYEPDDSYHIVHLRWSHQAVVGRDDDDMRKCFEEFLKNYPGELRITTNLEDPDV